MSGFEEAVLSGAEVSIAWASQRHWQPGAVVHHWPGRLVGVGLYVIQAGGVEVTVSGTTWQLQAGDAFLIPSDLLRERIAAPHGALWLSIGLRVQFHGRLDLAPLLGSARPWKPSPDTERLALGIVREWEDAGAPTLIRDRRPRDTVSRLIANGLGVALFGHCWRALRADADTVGIQHLDAPPWLWEAVQQIRKSPQAPLSELCQRVGVSPAHLRRTCHRYLGQSPQSYITEERLRIAGQLLRTTDKTVATVAAEVGFESLSHFTRIFTQRYLTSPARYRQDQRSAGS